MNRESISQGSKALTHPLPAAKPSALQLERGSARSKPKAFPVVGIGASAGGYESFTKFLEKLAPDTGMAFVLVQHLDPTHESKLSELLSRATRLPVIEVTRNVKVKPDHVYVIPPNKNLIISSGQLRLSPRRKREMPPMPVDSFLRSLAEDQGHNSVGIIFSGNGSDGTLGLEAIKGSDGLTFAQDPKTAKFTGMPRSAIASGCVDFILAPEQMAREVAKLPRHPHIGSSSADKGAETPGELSRPLGQIYSMLRSASGVDFAPYKQTTLKRRITRRMVVHKIATLPDYVRFLQTHPAEVDALFDDVLITVTRFFRDPKSFNVLEKKVFPALVKDHSRRQPIRIWVPACSSGEEVYSIAMILMEFLGARAGDHPIQIYGTDISENAIAKARAGVYRANIALDVSPARLRRFFNKTDDSYRIGKAIRDLCVFARQNICADPPFSRIDLISCQNLLIYLGPEVQRRVIPIFHYALQPNGFLLLSPSESIGNLSQLFTQADKKQRLYVKSRPLAESDVAFEPKVFAEETAGVPEARPRAPEPVRPNIEKSAERVLLNHYAPSGVVIDSKMQVLQFRGYTAAYLEHTPGAASLNLLKMVRNDLAGHLRAVIAKALKQRSPARKEILWARAKDQKRHLKIEVIPFKVPPCPDPFLLVLFEEGRAVAEAPGGNGSPARTRSGNRSAREKSELSRLREELEFTRESLQATIEEQEASNEELKSANEEIQSSNEELQSTNEELETSKEELQSTNEELATVNDELQNANLEANRVNNDLSNLLASVQIPVVMLDTNFTVRRFTPAAQKFFSLIPTDIGRSLMGIKINLDVDGLDKMITDVIDTLNVREIQVRDRHGHWYALRIRPYRTQENKIDGVVLALFDIDEFKRSLEQMSEIMWEPFLALDGDLRVVKANEAFYEKFQVTNEATEGKYIYELGNGQWNIPRLRNLLEQVLPNETRIRNFPVEHTFPNLGTRRMLLNARRMNADESEKETILLAIRDVSDPVNA